MWTPKQICDIKTILATLFTIFLNGFKLLPTKFPNRDKIYQAVNWCINKLPETLNLAAIDVLLTTLHFYVSRRKNAKFTQNSLAPNVTLTKNSAKTLKHLSLLARVNSVSKLIKGLDVEVRPYRGRKSLSSISHLSHAADA